MDFFHDLFCTHIDKDKLPFPSGFLEENKGKAVIIDGELIDIHLHDLVNMTESEKQFCIDAMKLKLEVLSSEEFRDIVLKRPVTETNGLTRLECYNRLMSGYDNNDKTTDSDIDLIITMYNGNSKTIGYTYMKLKIWTNRKFFNSWMKQPDGLASAAGHFLHEYLHCIGFKHKYRHRGTVPYEWGYIMRDLVKARLGGKKLTKLNKDI